MKKFLVFGLVFWLILLFSVPSFAYYLSPEEIYGEPDKGYDEGYDEGYEDGFLDGGGNVIYKTREVTLKEYTADHQTRFRELYITLLLVIGMCVVPTVLLRYGYLKSGFEESFATLMTVVYLIIVSPIIGYIMYRIDYLVPCISIIVLWGIISKRILTE